MCDSVNNRTCSNYELLHFAWDVLVMDNVKILIVYIIHMYYMYTELLHRRSRFLLWNVSADMSQNNEVILISNELNLQIASKVK